MANLVPRRGGISADSIPASAKVKAGKILLGLLCAVAIAWLYLRSGAGLGTEEMDMGDGNTMTMPAIWSPAYAGRVLVMWAVMMAAMMLPTAAPAILEAALIAPRRPERASGIRIALGFTAGYLAIWTLFSGAATLLQWALDSAHLLSDGMASRSAVLSNVVIIAIGLYQLTPLKRACLRRCRSRDGCAAQDARQGAGPVAQGMRYGVSCLGCCAVLMGLLFVGGLMNLALMAVIALWVLAEKTLAWGIGIARVGGAGLIAWGVVSSAATLL
jgi:predicted metal-binding membrane protein